MSRPEAMVSTQDHSASQWPDWDRPLVSRNEQLTLYHHFIILQLDALSCLASSFTSSRVALRSTQSPTKQAYLAALGIHVSRGI